MVSLLSSINPFIFSLMAADRNLSQFFCCFFFHGDNVSSYLFTDNVCLCFMFLVSTFAINILSTGILIRKRSSVAKQCKCNIFYRKNFLPTQIAKLLACCQSPYTTINLRDVVNHFIQPQVTSLLLITIYNHKSIVDPLIYYKPKASANQLLQPQACC